MMSSWTWQRVLESSICCFLSILPNVIPKTDTKKMVESQLQDLSKDLSARLQEEVFTDDERDWSLCYTV